MPELWLGLTIPTDKILESEDLYTMPYFLEYAWGLLLEIV
jgi:hypothetical protein